jgi:PmbA protein
LIGLDTHAHIALLEAAKKAGAQNATVIFERQNSTKISLHNGQVDKAQQSQEQTFGLEVIINHKRASVSFSGANPDVKTLAQRAVDIANASPADETAIIASREQYVREIPDLNLYDAQTVDTITPEDLKETAKTINDVILKAQNIQQAETGFKYTVDYTEILTSNGFEGAYRTSRFDVHGIAYAGSNLGMERDYEFSSARHFNDLKPATDIGTLAAERAVARLNPRKVKTGNFPVIFDRRVSESLVAHITDAVKGTSVTRGESWLLESMNQPILPEAYSLIDDPTIPRGLGSLPFDDEGLPCNILNIIENGVLKNWLLDLGTAKKLGLQSNGRAQRYSSDAPFPAYLSTYLTPGKQTVDDLISDIKQGLYVTNLIGSVSGSVNPTTGAYSRGASGFWIENGQITFPVSEITIAGNMLDMLRTIEVANDLEFTERKNAPTVKIQSMMVAGQS